MTSRQLFVLLRLLLSCLIVVARAPHAPAPLIAQSNATTLTLAPDGQHIIGGKTALPGAWPWQVLVLPPGLLCGGSLLDAGWVLTAAHCLEGVTASQVKVVLGEHDRTVNEGTEQTRGVAALFVHPNYNPATADNDVALLQLRMPALLTAQVAPILLVNSPVHDALVTPNTLATVTGWGRTVNGGEASTILMEATLPIVAQNTCGAIYPNLTDNMLCAGLAAGGKDSCQGDSGGPLVVPDGAGWRLAGVVSFGSGAGCALPNTYGVYARVSHYTAWLAQTIAAAPPPPSTVLTVTKTSDTADGVCDADCSLREAVMATNSDTGIDQIIVPAGVYTLTIPGVAERQGATGDLNVALPRDPTATRALTISGAGPQQTIIDGNRLDRVLSIFGGNLVLQGLMIRNGKTATTGGGIYVSSAHLTLRNAIITGNLDEESGFGGGGIQHGGPGNLTLINSEVSHNVVTFGGGGGIRFASDDQLVISNTLVISNSANHDGGIMNYGNALITQAQIDYNRADDGPVGGIGHIDRKKRLEIIDSSVSHNTAKYNSGGIEASAEQGLVTLIRAQINYNLALDGNGGGIANSNSYVTLIDSQVIGNRAPKGAWGGLYNGRNMTVTHSLISQNFAGNGSGGAQNYGEMKILTSTIANNTGTYGAGLGNAGTLLLQNSQVLTNVSTAGIGAGIHNQGAQFDEHRLTIINSLIAGNRSTYQYGEGGGIANDQNAQLYLVASTVGANVLLGSQSKGGGIRNNGIAVIEASTIHNNRAHGQGGGGIANDYSGAITITNSTLSHNQAFSNGEQQNTGAGGALFNYGVLKVRNSTIAFNHAAVTGGGVWVNGGAVGITIIQLHNAILTDNGVAAQLLQNCQVFQPAPNTITSIGGNVSNDATCYLNAAGDQPNVDPLLLPLADYGGATQTHALASNSPAIGAANNCPANDQRGVARPQGAACDSGAFEWRDGETTPATPMPILTPQPTDTPVPNEPALTANHTTGAPGSYFTFNASGFPASASATLLINGIIMRALATNGDGSLRFALNTERLQPGDYLVTVQVNPSASSTIRIDSTAPLRAYDDLSFIVMAPNIGPVTGRALFLPLVKR